MALILSGGGFSGAGGKSIGLLGMTLMASFGWWSLAFILSNLVLTKEEVERVVAESIRDGGEEGGESMEESNKKSQYG